MDKPATPLPWKIGKHNCIYDGEDPVQVVGADDEIVCCNTCYYPTAVKPGDAAYIAHACNAYPHLTAINAELVEALEAALRCFDLSEGLSIRDEQAIKQCAASLARAKENSNG